MEPKNGKFGSDDFPFQLGDFQVPAVSFQGLYVVKEVEQ